ncbi:unnamed protein product, partial [Sphacelaria rigidula]
GEVAFYLRETREQFRVKGRLQVVSVSEVDPKLIKARNHQWTQISPASRASFASNLIPGLEIADEEQQQGDAAPAAAEQDIQETKVSSDVAEPADDFCLVLLWPSQVDHLVLKGGQTRHSHTLVEGQHGDSSSEAQASFWRTAAVNP